MGIYIGKDYFGNDVSMADSDAIEQNRSAIDSLLWILAKPMRWQDISHVFVSDLSTMSDFCLGEEELKDISAKVGFKVEQSDYLYEIALRMKPAN